MITDTRFQTHRNPASKWWRCISLGRRDGMPLSFSVLLGRFAIAKLAQDAALPREILDTKGFVSISRTSDELSIVATDDLLAHFPTVDHGWSCIKVHGPFSFDEVGILASLLNPLAAAGIGIFAISTFDTDYLLVKHADIDRTVHALQSAGHRRIDEG